MKKKFSKRLFPHSLMSLVILIIIIGAIWLTAVWNRWIFYEFNTYHSPDSKGVIIIKSNGPDCDNAQPKQQEKPALTATQPQSVRSDIDIFRDVQALQEFQKDVKEKFGDDFKILRTAVGGKVDISKEFIQFAVVDPNNTKQVFGYVWRYGTGFVQPMPVQVKHIDPAIQIDDLAS